MSRIKRSISSIHTTLLIS